MPHRCAASADSFPSNKSSRSSRSRRKAPTNPPLRPFFRSLIGLNDIPELAADFWREAKPVEPDRTEQVTLSIERSVLNRFRGPGKGYRTRINRVLESYARAQGGSD